ncbi:hypothetical protein Ahy_B10g106405 [Arachis hypogaea]|uniref:Leucine-rich repeat-containing N-terminal plant-type domain-containing protein n=1 Tax=Arachis hypogaea TaxID=3818 RepID=A0A444XAU3_ARAHY|nr:hypothetical protein Ahy_B10g106405 [Arachis hypogaea]
MGIRYQITCAVVVFVVVVAEILELCICANSSTTLHSPCLERERQALVKFKASLNDPSNLLSSWHGDDCCRWKGIGCDNVTGHVVMLDLTPPYLKCWRSMSDDYDCDLLDYQYLEATNVNSSLLELEYLTHLDLTGNTFYGSHIPMFIGSMQRLRYLSLSDAGFGGRIPSNLGNLTNLHFLDLSGNGFSPDSNINWISQLPLLEHLDMSYAYDTFQVNIINLTITAPKLQFLSLAANGLSVSNLDALQNMTSLVHLDLGGNNITSIPCWFGNFKKLEYLCLSERGLHGPIPNAFQNATFIEFLDLSENNFDSFPFWFHKFEKLKLLFLSSNNFQDTIPDALQNMTSIESLDLSSNSFTSVPSCGSLPGHIGHIMPNLVNLRLGNNLINGSIPNSLCQNDQLEILDLSNNRLFGEIPNCWKDNQKWEEINLSFNELSGFMKGTLGGCGFNG